MSRVMLVLPSCNSLRSYSAALSAAVFAVAVVLLSVSAASSAAGTDLEWPSIGLGTAGLQQRTEDVVMLALSQGVRLVDTAQAAEWYDERAIGEALKYFPAADEVMLVTKIHPRYYALAEMDLRLAQSKDFLARSEANPSGNSRRIESVLLHTPYCWRGQCTPEQEAVSWETAWKNLEQLQHKHNITTIGVSNFDAALLARLLRINSAPVAMVQNWMDPFHQDKETRAFAKANGIQYMAYSSFGTQWQGKFGGTNPVLSNDVLQRIASNHSLTVSQVVLAWVIAEGCIAIPRSSQPDHITENFGSSYHSHHFDAYEVSTRSASNGEELSMSSDPNLIRLDMDDLEAIRALDGALGTPWD